MPSSTTYININQGAGSSSSSSVPNCLDFPGSSGSSVPIVDFGIRYRGGEVENNEGFYEFLARASSGGYVFCESVSGAHFFLLGLTANGQTPARFGQIGNFWGSDDAAYPVGSFAASEGPLADEWGLHGAVIGPDSSNSNVYLHTYWNGLITGRWLMWTVASGKTRKMRAAGNTQGSLYFGASGSHNGFTGRLVAAREFARKRPIDHAMPYVPSPALGNVWGRAGYDQTYDFCDGLWVPDSQSGIVQDHSRGFDQGLGGALYKSTGILTNWFPGQPSPSWVNDPTCPHGVQEDITTAAAGYIGLGSDSNPITPPALPAGARIYDDFARAPQDWFWQRASGPSLGSTRSDASLGAQAWEQHMVEGDDLTNWDTPIVAKAGAIRNRHIRTYSKQRWIAWPTTGNAQANMDVRISRMNTSDMGYTGIAYRISDRQNFWVVHSQPGNNGSANRDVYVQKFTGGAWGGGFEGAWTAPNDWTTLRVTCVGNLHTFMVDNGAGGWNTLGTVTDAYLNSATKAGVVAINAAGAGASSAWNGTDFTVI